MKSDLFSLHWEMMQLFGFIDPLVGWGLSEHTARFIVSCAARRLFDTFLMEAML
jgi:hypothetical protein